MKDQQLLKKLDNLLSKYTDPTYSDDPESIRGWRKELQRAMIKKDLKKHEGILLIIEKLRVDLVEMDILLKTQSSEKLPDIKRDRLLDRKDLYIWFLGLFSNIDKEIASIEKKVKEESEHYNENKENYI